MPPQGPDWDPRYDKIIAVLKSDLKPRKARELAILCGYDTKGSASELRRAIDVLNEQFYIPIRGTPTGFLWCTAPEQMDHYAESIKQRANALLKRASKLHIIAEKMRSEQEK